MTLDQRCQPTLERFDQWNGFEPLEWRHNRLRSGRTVGSPKQEQLPVSFHERLQREQRARLDADGPHTQHIEGLVETWLRQQLLDPRSFDFRVFQRASSGFCSAVRLIF